MRSQLSSIKSTSAAQTTTIQRESIEEKPDWGDAHEDFGEIYKNNEETDLGDVRNKYTTRPPPATNNSLFGGLNKTGETLTFNPGNVVKESEPAKTTPSNNFLFGGLNKTGGTLSFNIGNKESEASQPAASSKPLFGGLAKSGGTSNFTSGKPEKESESPQTIQSNNSLFGSSGKPASTLSFNFGNKDTEPSKMTPTSNPLFGALVKPGGTFTFNSGKSDKESESPQTLPSNTTLFNGLVKPGGLFNSKAPETSTSTSAATNGESNNKDNGEDGDAEDAPPPKIEIIKHEEPGAVFSTKCSLFNFVNNEYKKVGIGFLHIKKTDSGTQLLIRAATALGTVWINTYINSFFKAEKKGKNKIQFSYPSTKGAKTSFVRVVDVDDAVAYLTGVKKP
uniref:RanBD1 domain-containing protein n=1 Tax=Panagrolaimus davidi TaxID=227884 RepID=A0A914QTG9_9BILA